MWIMFEVLVVHNSNWCCKSVTDVLCRWNTLHIVLDIPGLSHQQRQFSSICATSMKTRNVGQYPTWWPPYRIYVAPSVQRRKVWLTPTSRVPCSNDAKTRNPLKFAGVPQTRQQISDASGPKFTVLWEHLGATLLFNNFFRLSICSLVAKI